MCACTPCSVISPACVGVRQTRKINIQHLLTGQDDQAQKSRQLMLHVISNSRLFFIN